MSKSWAIFEGNPIPVWTLSGIFRSISLSQNSGEWSFISVLCRSAWIICTGFSSNSWKCSIQGSVVRHNTPGLVFYIEANSQSLYPGARAVCFLCNGFTSPEWLVPPPWDPGLSPGWPQKPTFCFFWHGIPNFIVQTRCKKVVSSIRYTINPDEFVKWNLI